MAYNSCYSSPNAVFVTSIMSSFVSNSSSVLVIFRAQSHENEARVPNFEGLESNFPLIFFIKSISTANDVKPSCILCKRTSFNLNAFLALFACL